MLCFSVLTLSQFHKLIRAYITRLEQRGLFSRRKLQFMSKDSHNLGCDFVSKILEFVVTLVPR